MKAVRDYSAVHTCEEQETPQLEGMRGPGKEQQIYDMVLKPNHVALHLRRANTKQKKQEARFGYGNGDDDDSNEAVVLLKVLPSAHQTMNDMILSTYVQKCT